MRCNKMKLGDVANLRMIRARPARAIYGLLTHGQRWALFLLCSQLGSDYYSSPPESQAGTFKVPNTDNDKCDKYDEENNSKEYIQFFRKLAEGNLDGTDSVQNAEYFVFCMHQLHLQLQEGFMPAVTKLINTAVEENEKKDPALRESEIPMMQLRPFFNPFMGKMLDQKSKQLMFIDDGGPLVEEPEELSEEETNDKGKEANIPNGKTNGTEASKQQSQAILEDNDAIGPTEVPKASSSRPETPKRSSEPADVVLLADGVKRIQFDTPAQETSDPATPKKPSPPIRRPSSAVSSAQNSPGTEPSRSAIPQPVSRRILSFPRPRDLSPLESRENAQAERPTLPRRSSTLRPGPPLPPKPEFSPLQRRGTIPAESQPARQAKASSSITLPCLDITQNGQIYRESELLVDLMNIFRNHWPDRPYAVMNHLRNSLLIAQAVCDDPNPVFASDHGGSTAIKQTVCRFRRFRGDKSTLDLCLVLWDATYMTFREQSLLQETHRYKPQQAGESALWPGAQRVVWYPSWEPSKNLSEGIPDAFSKEKERVWSLGADDFNFEMDVSDGDWC
ncbi:hypothetical protein ABW19_dt0209375 [Dactylella cylindrospora]|nr:hypothetical protein ABW19_dt0209375 [Dactylella cylindrospora]